ncbi:MAG TPA: hypothetical protein VGJ26_09090 [Pirellulales bacterium]|jgi:hypothetical protein
MDRSAPSKRWFRYSLRTLFVVVTLIALGLGFEMKRIHNRHAMRAWLRDGNGWELTWEDYKSTPSQPSKTPGDPTMQIPRWRMWLGDEPMAQIGFEKSATPADRERVKRLFPEAMIWSD